MKLKPSHTNTRQIITTTTTFIHGINIGVLANEFHCGIVCVFVSSMNWARNHGVKLKPKKKKKNYNEIMRHSYSFHQSHIVVLCVAHSNKPKTQTYTRFFFLIYWINERNVLTFRFDRQRKGNQEKYTQYTRSRVHSLWK